MKLGDQSTTSGGSQLGCAAGVVIVKTLSKPDSNNFSKVEEELRRKFLKLSNYKIFERFYTAGLMIDVELKIRFNQLPLKDMPNGLLTSCCRSMFRMFLP